MDYQNGNEVAKAFREAHKVIETTEAILVNVAKEQIAIMRNVLHELGLDDHYKHRELKYFDWCTCEVGGYTEPNITVSMWERGRGGDPDLIKHTFQLDILMIAGKFDMFKAQFKQKHLLEAEQYHTEAKAAKQKQIDRLEAELAKLKEIT